MKSAIAIAAGLFGTLAAAPAFAQEQAGHQLGAAAAEAAPAEAAPAPEARADLTPITPADIAKATEAPKKGSLDAQLELLPMGTLSIKGGGVDDSTDTAAAFAMSAHLNYDVFPNVSIGLAPRLILGVKGKDGTKSGKEIDVGVRFTAHTEIAPEAHIFGFVAPGYSVIFVPDNDNDDPSGLVVALGAGVSYDFAPGAFVTGELGYQLGYQSVSINGTDLDLTTDYLHAGIGVGTRF